jgi:hypothetical protein
MVKGIYLPVDPDVALEVREFNGLPDYQAAVEGWIEAVDIPSLGVTLFVNEEGLLRHLPLNARAAFLWWYHVPATRNKAMLVGNAVLVGQPNEDGDHTDVPESVITMLATEGEYTVLIKVGAGADSYIDPTNGISNILLPLISGDPDWFASAARYEDYFSAAVWAMILEERWSEATETKVIPISQLPEHLR